MLINIITTHRRNSYVYKIKVKLKNYALCSTIIIIILISKAPHMHYTMFKSAVQTN